jgi:uncharacterized membrane protein
VYALILSIPLATLSARLAGPGRATHPTLADPADAARVLQQMARSWVEPHPARREGFDRVLVLYERDQPREWTAESAERVVQRIASEGGTEIS